MADQRSGRPGIWKVFCCLVPKDSEVDSSQPQPQQHSDVISGSYIDPENDGAQAQASVPQKMPQAVDMPSQDTEETYLRHIYDLEQELHAATENNRELSRQLNEMGHLVFPELGDCTQLSLLERLKVYLECQLMEKQDLERRIIEAEAALLEMENAVNVLQRRLQNADYSSTEQMDTQENDPLLPSSCPPLPTEAPVNKFFSKFHKRYGKKVVAPSLQKQNEADLPKQTTMQEALARELCKETLHQGVPPRPGMMAEEGHFSETNKIPAEHEQKLFQVTSNLEESVQPTASSQCLTPLPGNSTAESSHIDGAYAYVSDRDVQAEEDSCFNMRSSGNPEPCSRNLAPEESEVEDPSILSNVAALPIVEERHETQGEMVIRGQENGNCALDIATKKPVGMADPTTSQKLEVQADHQDPVACKAKPIAKWKVQVTHSAEKDASGDDLLDSNRSVNICFVHRGKTKMGDLASETSQGMSVQKNTEAASCAPNSLILSAKEESKSYLKRCDGSSWEGSIHLPSTSVKTLETTQTIFVGDMSLKGPPRADEAKDELCTSSDYNMAVAGMLDAKTGEMCPSLYGPAALKSSYVESH